MGAQSSRAAYVCGMSVVALVRLVDAAAILMIDARFYLNAKQHAEQGSPVHFRAGSLVVDTPAVWLLGCLR